MVAVPAHEGVANTSSVAYVPLPAKQVTAVAVQPVQILAFAQGITEQLKIYILVGSKKAGSSLFQIGEFASTSPAMR